MEFAFIILGVSSMDKFMPSTYFNISHIINNSNNWLDDFVNTFFKEHLSYYFDEEHNKVENISNKIVQDYSKSLAIYKANLFANDVITDTNYSNSDNTYKFMEFVKTFKLPPNNDIFGEIITINHFIKKLGIFIGNDGILSKYTDIVNNTINPFDGGKPTLHPYYIVDFLEQIKFYNIIKLIHYIITETRITVPTDYTNAYNALITGTKPGNIQKFLLDTTPIPPHSRSDFFHLTVAMLQSILTCLFDAVTSF
jgi:hypothetical protein